VPTAAQKGPAGEVTRLGSIGFDGIAGESTVTLAQMHARFILAVLGKSRRDVTFDPAP
jgi:hypothetical protein